MFSKFAKSSFVTLGHTNKQGFSGLLKKRLAEILPARIDKLKEIRKNFGAREIQKVKLDQVIGGMRGIIGMFYDTSHLDPRTGITFRGYSIQEICEFLPRAKEGPEGEGDEPLPEGLFWLLLTGELPNHQEFEDFSHELKARSELPRGTLEYIQNLPPAMHPMTQLSSAILHLQPESVFTKAYAKGIPKAQYWEYIYEDALELLAKIPALAALVYRHTYRNNDFIAANKELDWAGNFSNMLGYDSFHMRECLRGYLSIHSDHEGGNVSAHTSHLVGSALADPYLCASSGINGLAGPLHGLANQEVLRWLMTMREEIGDKPSDEKIKEYVMNTLSQGKVVPGYGHAVLRHTDPRFLHQKAFADKYIKNDPLVYLVKRCYRVIPGVLRQLGKVKNPYPNVDSHSGVLLNHYGLKEYDYYTTVFAVSRTIGLMANLILARAYSLPIERPLSVNIEWIDNKIKEAKELSSGII